MQEAIRELIISYCDILKGQIAEITGHFDDLQHNRVDHKAALARSLDIVHQITGLSGSMGYPEISVRSAPLEKFIRGLDTGGACPDGAELSQLLELFQAMKVLADDVTPEASALYNTDFSSIATRDADTTPGHEAYAEI